MVGIITEIVSSSRVAKRMALRSWWEGVEGQSHGVSARTQEKGRGSLSNWGT